MTIQRHLRGVLMLLPEVIHHAWDVTHRVNGMRTVRTLPERCEFLSEELRKSFANEEKNTKD